MDKRTQVIILIQIQACKAELENHEYTMTSVCIDTESNFWDPHKPSSPPHSAHKWSLSAPPPTSSFQ